MSVNKGKGGVCCINRISVQNRKLTCNSLRHLLTQMPPPSSERGFFPQPFPCYLSRENGRYDPKAPSEEGAVSEAD